MKSKLERSSKHVCAEEGVTCRIRQIIHKLLASICHMGVLLLFLGFLLECALSYMISLPLHLSQTHARSVTVINHLYMCIHLIAPLLQVDRPKAARHFSEREQYRQCEWAAFIMGDF